MSLSGAAQKDCIEKKPSPQPNMAVKDGRAATAKHHARGGGLHCRTWLFGAASNKNSDIILDF